MTIRDFRLYCVVVNDGNAVKRGLNVVYTTLKKQCIETEDRLVVRGLLCICTLIQRCKTNVDVLILSSFLKLFLYSTFILFSNICF
jgi:hypothetical protein